MNGLALRPACQLIEDKLSCFLAEHLCCFDFWSMAEITLLNSSVYNYNLGS